MKTPDTVVMARAKVMWGHSPDEVRDFLIASGTPRDEADSQVCAFVHERRLHIKRKGQKSILVGLLILLLPTAYFVAVALSRLDGRSIGYVLIFSLIGVFFFFRGLLDYLDPERNRTDISK